jgi:ribosomal protein S18 acetylase RimI-like enzyme
MIEIITATTNKEYEIASKLFQEYATWLNIDLSFQSFEEELLQLNEMYTQPQGVILLAKYETAFIGCVAVRQKKPFIGELKRMYVQPAFQQKKVGVSLLNKALDCAKDMGYKKIWLDTLDTMLPAINLYKQAGFYEIDPYYFNPEKNAVFFEKEL